MNWKSFWQYKTAMYFHDPVGKPFAFYRKGGHLEFARQVFRRYTGLPLKFYATEADRAATGADRPVIDSPRGTAGAIGSVGFAKSPVITHPLAPFPLLVSHFGGETPRTTKEMESELDRVLEVIERLGAPRSDEVAAKLRGDGDVADEELQEIRETLWDDPDLLSKSLLVFWRRFRDDLIADSSDYTRGDLLWERMPAETRCPDISIWEHLRVAAALCFIAARSEARQPWLFTFSLGPVQEFIAQSRTSRDLWTSSFLLSDLSWHAMLPIVQRYGPDCIMYPDLRGNPRADVWLAMTHDEALPPYFEGDPSSFAATLPHTFTAILPRGGEGDLPPLEQVAAECRERLQQRWLQLADTVRDWVAAKLAANGVRRSHWQKLWDEQVPNAFHTQWNAVPWIIPEQQREFGFGGALPFQDRTQLKTPRERDEAAIRARFERLGRWMPLEAWAHYQGARDVFGKMHAGFLQYERGFDYAPTHHQLRERHRIRKQMRRLTQPAGGSGQGGEKCRLVHRLEALWDPDVPAGKSQGLPAEQHRQTVREFWKILDKDGGGQERLSAIGAIKRFLVEATQAGEFNAIWAGPRSVHEAADPDGRYRIPFPSTATIAAQSYLEQLVKSPGVEPALWEVVSAYRRAGLEQTGFARALPRLAAAAKSGSTAEAFLRLDTQTSLFPHVIEANIQARQAVGDEQGAAAYRMLLEPVRRLRQAVDRPPRNREDDEISRPDAAANSPRGLEPPAARFAVLMLDADNMGRLLLGDREAIGASWRDVLHPEIVRRMGEPERQAVKNGWPDLLEARRLMGPSLHAFISGALANFAHYVVPWVVEREFGGRVIYAGGDEVLALAPAEDALPIAARLQQLFSSAWVIDTRHTADPWEWRRAGWPGAGEPGFDPATDRKRFLIPLRSSDGQPLDLESHRADHDFEPHVADRSGPGTDRSGRCLALLGHAASLSASIVYAHYKTPLDVLLPHGRRLLEEVAKGRLRRRAVALSHYSRNGPKSEVGLNWDIDGRRLAAFTHLERVIRAFRIGESGGGLSTRLPYKLREVSRLAICRTPDAQEFPEARLLNGLLRWALDRPPEDGLLDSLVQVWRAGFRTHGVQPAEADSSASGLAEDLAERSVDGLLLCRALRQHAGEDE